MELSEFLDKEVYPYLDRAQVFGDLEPRDKGSSYLCRCPKCGQHRAFIYKNGFKIKCNRRGECSYESTILEHISGPSPRGAAYLRACEVVAGMVGVSLPKREFDTEKEAEKLRYQSALEATFSRYQEGLSDECKRYLDKRGFQNLIPFGTARVSDSEVAQIELGINSSWDGRLVLQVRDRWGRLKGLSARDIYWTKEGKTHKYLHTTGLDVSALGLIGLDQNVGHDIIIVEGIIDVFKAREKGITNVVAIAGGGDSLSAARWDYLSSIGIRRATIVLDNDGNAGPKGTYSAVRHADSATNPQEIFVVDPEQLGAGVKDLDEFLNQNGSERVAGLLETRRHKDWYRAEHLATQHDLTSQTGKVAYLEECWRLYTSATTARREHQLTEFFLPRACALSQTDPEVFMGFLEEVKARIAQEKREKKLKDLSNRIQEQLAKNGYTSALETLSEGYDELQALSSTTRVEKVSSLYDEAIYHDDILERYSGKEFIGLPQVTLPTLDESTLGLRNLIAIAGPPGSGKTSITSQFVMDILINNEDTCAVYWSGEMSRAEIGIRLKSHLMRMDWKYLTRKSTPAEKLEANRRLLPFSKRLVILDEGNCPIPTVSGIMRIVNSLKYETGCKRVVLVFDYFQIYPVPLEVEFKSENEQDAYRQKQMKAYRTAMGGDPVMFISETRKPGDSGQWAAGMASVRGSARITYGSDMVFLINPFCTDDLLQFFGIDTIVQGTVSTDYLYLLNPPKETELVKKEKEKQIKEVRKLMKRDGAEYINLEIVKARDGGTRETMMVTHFHKQSRFIEGLRQP